MADKAKLSASELFLKGIEQIAHAVALTGKPIDASPLQAAEAMKRQQEKHEERKRRISQDIAGGARLTRNL